MSTKTTFIRTDAAGAFTYERNFKGVIHGLEFQIGTLTTPDIDVTDDTYGVSFLSVNGVAADTAYYPGEFLQDNAGADLEVDTGVKAGTAAVCMGVLKVVVTGGGNTFKGRLVVLYD